MWRIRRDIEERVKVTSDVGIMQKKSNERPSSARQLVRQEKKYMGVLSLTYVVSSRLNELE
jgi:hypothetical protein